MAERQAEQHSAQHIVPGHSCCRAAGRQPQADAVVLEVAVVDEDSGGVERQAHQARQALGRAATKCGSAGQRGGQEGEQVGGQHRLTQQRLA